MVVGLTVWLAGTQYCNGLMVDVTTMGSDLVLACSGTVQLPPSLSLYTGETGETGKKEGNKSAPGQEAEQSNLIRISSPLF